MPFSSLPKHPVTIHIYAISSPGVSLLFRRSTFRRHSLAVPRVSIPMRILSNPFTRGYRAFLLLAQPLRYESFSSMISYVKRPIPEFLH